MNLRKIVSLATPIVVAAICNIPGIAISSAGGAASAENGKYLVKIAGCNDCHTPGYLMSNGNVPEAQWLVGDTLGWKGPWGTTYATNLRIRMDGFTEEQWLSYAKALKARPPMPWFTLNQMRDSDLRSIYRFVRQLGRAGTEAPPALPPGEEPPPPYAIFPAPPPVEN